MNRIAININALYFTSRILTLSLFESTPVGDWSDYFIELFIFDLS